MRRFPDPTSPDAARELLDSLSVIVYRLDARAGYRLCEVRGAVESLTGYTAAELLADDEFTTARIHPDDRATVSRRMAQLVASGRATAEYRFQRADGRYVWFRDESRSIPGEDGTPDYAIGTTSDITDVVEERVQAEADAAKLQGIVAAAASAVVITSDRGLIESFNRAAEQMFGYAESDVIGKNVALLMPESEARDHDGHVGRYNVNGQRRVIGATRDVLGQRSDGSTFPLHLALSEARYQGALHFCGILTDVTEAREMERELRALNVGLEERVKERTEHLQLEIAERREAQDALAVAERERRLFLARMLDLQDAERAHISYELHDEVGQQLTSLMIGLRVLALADTPEGMHEHADALRVTVSDTLEQVRSLAMETRSSSLDDLGIAATLRTELTAIQDRAGIRVTLDASGGENPRLPRQTEVTLYRVIHSALANVVRHSGANSLAVYIRQTDDGVSGIVEDDGVGFDVGQAMSEPVDARFGLLAMQERARAIGGDVTVDSTPGEGCSVLVTLPVVHAADAASD